MVDVHINQPLEDALGDTVSVVSNNSADQNTLPVKQVQMGLIEMNMLAESLPAGAGLQGTFNNAVVGQELGPGNLYRPATPDISTPQPALPQDDMPAPAVAPPSTGGLGL